jgi:hypothetical protein
LQPGASSSEKKSECWNVDTCNFSTDDGWLLTVTFCGVSRGAAGYGRDDAEWGQRREDRAWKKILFMHHFLRVYHLQSFYSDVEANENEWWIRSPVSDAYTRGYMIFCFRNAGFCLEHIPQCLTNRL